MNFADESIFISVLVILLGLCFVLLFTQSWLIRSDINSIDEKLEGLDRVEIYNAIHNKTVIERTKTNGVYNYNSQIYCVWYEGRKMDEIQRTDYHESCHALVDLDRDHFCDGESEFVGYKGIIHEFPEHYDLIEECMR